MALIGCLTYVLFAVSPNVTHYYCFLILSSHPSCSRTYLASRQ